MWWRALGVAVVLLCVGVAGGYAVADRNQEEAASSTTLEPIPGVSPAVPTPVVPSYAPDPDDPPLTTSGLVAEPVKLRLNPDGAGVKADIPVGWRENRPEDTNFWNFVDPDASQGTYVLRVTLWRPANVSIAAAMAQRIAALEDAETHGGLSDFHVTAQSDDTMEATYVDGGHLRFTTERWVSFDGSTAYASVAVTGREVDRPGLGDLLSRTVTSLRELPPKPPGGNDQG
ncbi:MAG TPA: hypothetical protein VFV89_02480 [Nocardioides sp.]|uniref:hypothetical protein n=1 Tax=Nocardioides sp. TaxID=35761 RepID=UPI002E30304F|nr:hypothetical protein [Nocardioides sp.]HEX5086644.1 hypothetical protein [Nocardioides sp.]